MPSMKPPGPSTSAPALVPVRGREANVEIVLSRTVAHRENVGGGTCPNCGERPATRIEPLSRTVGITAFGFLAKTYTIKRRLCEACWTEEVRVQKSMARAFLILCVPVIANGALSFLGDLHMLPDWLSSPLTRSMISAFTTLGVAAHFATRMLLQRRIPKMLRADDETVTLRVPRSWARVLADEQPQVLAERTVPRGLVSRRDGANAIDAQPVVASITKPSST